MLGHDLGEPSHVSLCARRGEHERGADQVRVEELFRRPEEVEQESIARRETKDIDRPHSASGEDPVRDQHALWPPGGSRGEDDVGDVFGADVPRRDGRCRLPQHVRLYLFPEHRWNALGQPIGVTPVGEQQRHLGLVGDLREARLRERRVEGHIGAARFQEAPDGDDHLDRAVEQDAYGDAPADAASDQQAGDLIGATVQLLVGELLPFEDDSYRARRRRGLSFEHLGQSGFHL